MLDTGTPNPLSFHLLTGRSIHGKKSRSEKDSKVRTEIQSGSHKGHKKGHQTHWEDGASEEGARQACGKTQSQEGGSGS